MQYSSKPSLNWIVRQIPSLLGLLLALLPSSHEPKMYFRSVLPFLRNGKGNLLYDPVTEFLVNLQSQ